MIDLVRRYGGLDGRNERIDDFQTASRSPSTARPRPARARCRAASPETYGFHHLDTGLTYRATAKALLDAGLPLDDEAVAEKMAREVELAGLDRDILSKHEIGEAASKIAVMPAVRRALVEAQRRFSEKAPGTVLDGRDIGTVVCPAAPVKLYVTAVAGGAGEAPLRRDHAARAALPISMPFSRTSSAATSATWDGPTAR